MEQEFIDILKKLVAEQGQDTLTDARKYNAFLADYAGNDYKKERRLLVLAVEAGAAKAIAGAGDLASCKKAQARELEEQGLTPAAAEGIVDALALVLRGEEKPKARCKSCGKELEEGWKACPFCTALVTPPAAQAGMEGDKAFAEGNKYLDKKKYDKAIRLFTKAINLGCADMSQAYQNRGSVYHVKDQLDKAISDLTKAISLDPNNANAYVARACAYAWKGQHDQAISDCTTAINLDPNFATAYASRGNAYNMKDQYDKAVGDYTKAISLDPNNAITYECRASAYNLKGQYDLAIGDLTKAIDLDPNSANAYASRGNVYYSKGMKKEAIRDLEKALSLDPNNQFAKDILRNVRGY